MKRRFFKVISCVLLLSAAILTGCSDDENTSDYIYEFPEIQTPTLAIDQKGTIEFQSAGPWSVYTTSFWVRFIEEEEQVSSLAGTEGKHTITYVINDKVWGFNDQEATIQLSMNGQTVTIATITRTAKTPELTIYQTDYETYEDAAVSTVNLDWSNNAFKYQARVKFSTNFEWKIEDMPEWIANNDDYYYATEGKAGESAYFYLTGDYAHYTKEDMTAEVKVVGKNDPSISMTFTITADGADKVLFIPGQLSSQGITFEANGKTTSVNGVEIDQFSFNMTAPAGGYLLRSINTEMGYSGQKYYGVDYGYGLSFDSDWIEAMGRGYKQLGEHIWDYSFTVSSFPNSGNARTATLFALPVEVLSSELNYNIENMFKNDGTIKPEYEKYIAGDITQKAGEGGTGSSGLLFTYPDFAPMYGATLEKTTNQDIISIYQNDWGVSADNVYILTYETPSSGSMAQIVWEGSEPDFEITGDDTDWLYAEPRESGFLISMRPTQGDGRDYFEGGVVLVVDGAPKFAIHCMLLSNPTK